jgi:hypothetical protein
VPPEVSPRRTRGARCLGIRLRPSERPARIRTGMNTLIAQELASHSRDTSEEAAAWAKKMEECNRLRSAYQAQQAADLMSFEELATKLKGLEETKWLAHTELATLEAREEVASELERDRDTLLERWSTMVPEGLDGLTGEERNKVYRMLRLEVMPTPEGYEVTGAFCGLLYSKTDGLREATVKKLKGARLRVPFSFTVEVQAIGRGTTEPINSL